MIFYRNRNIEYTIENFIMYYVPCLSIGECFDDLGIHIQEWQNEGKHIILLTDMNDNVIGPDI